MLVGSLVEWLDEKMVAWMAAMTVVEKVLSLAAWMVAWMVVMMVAKMAEMTVVMMGN